MHKFVLFDITCYSAVLQWTPPIILW